MCSVDCRVRLHWVVFTKLASQLTADKLVDLAVIPFIFATQTLVSYVSSIAVAKAFGFKKRRRNFVIAMGVSSNTLSPVPSIKELIQS